MQRAPRPWTGPDTVTILRMPLAVMLVVTGSHHALAFAIFAVAVATDVADGWWARRRGTASDRGARLDSLADVVFVAATAWVVVTAVILPPAAIVGAAIAIVGTIRVASLLVGRLRLDTWAIMHTDLNRASGAALAVAAGIGIWRAELPVAVLVAASGIALAAAVEELIIVARAPRYDVDYRGPIRATIRRVIR